MAQPEQENSEWIAKLCQKAASSDKSRSTALILSIFLGMFGADRLYLGYGVLGILKLCTLGGLGLWWLLDIVLLLVGTLRDANGGVLHSGFER